MSFSGSQLLRSADTTFDQDYEIDLKLDKESTGSPASEKQQDVPKPTATETARCHAAIVHAQMYAIGEKYLIPGLKSLARARFRGEFEDHPSTTPVVMNATVISEVYTTTPETDRGLRDFVLEYALRRIRKLKDNKDFCQEAADIPRFGFELWERTVSFVLLQQWKTFEVHCQHCDREAAYGRLNGLQCKHQVAAQQSSVL